MSSLSESEINDDDDDDKDIHDVLSNLIDEAADLSPLRYKARSKVSRIYSQKKSCSSCTMSRICLTPAKRLCRALADPRQLRHHRYHILLLTKDNGLKMEHI